MTQVHSGVESFSSYGALDGMVGDLISPSGEMTLVMFKYRESGHTGPGSSRLDRVMREFVGGFDGRHTCHASVLRLSSPQNFMSGFVVGSVSPPPPAGHRVCRA